MISDAVYLKRVSVYNLIHGDKKVAKVVRFPTFWLFVTLISFYVIIKSENSLYFEFNRAIGNTNGKMIEKFCECCGMPMGNADEMYGSNADGSKNEDYCKYCFENGAFTSDCTMNEMKCQCR